MAVEVWSSGSYRCVHAGGCAGIFEGRGAGGRMLCVKVARGCEPSDARSLEAEFRLQRRAWNMDPSHFARALSFSPSLVVRERGGHGDADLAAAKGHPALLQERLSGVTLAQLAECHSLLGFAEGERVALEVLRALCTLETLRHVHHDVHPGNIFLCLDGTVRLIDLGVACSLDADDHVRITNGYEDPRDKDRPWGCAPYANGDVYSLARVALRCTFGDFEASGRSLPDVSLARWCTQALAYAFGSPHEALVALLTA